MLVTLDEVRVKILPHKSSVLIVSFYREAVRFLASINASNSFRLSVHER